MPRWSYPVYWVMSGQLASEHVPFAGVRFTDTLRDGGSFTGRMPAGHPAFSVDAADDLWRYMVVPCRDRRPMGAFILTSLPNEVLDSPTIGVQGVRVDELLNRSELYDDLNFTAVDQLDIARDLLRYWLGYPTQFTASPVTQGLAAWKQYPWVRLGGGSSGVLRTRQVTTSGASDDGYRGVGGKFMGQLLKQLSELGDEPGVSAKPGFEYRWDYGIDSDGFFVQVNFGYPMIGTSKDAPGKIVFEFPGSAVLSASMGVDGSNFASRFRVLGQDREGTRPTESRYSQERLGQGYPLVDRNLSDSSSNEPGTLGDKADAQLTLSSTVNTGFALTLNGDGQPMFGTYNLGDWVTLRLKRGGRLLPDKTVRFTGWSVDVDDTGEFETITPQLGYQ